MSHCLTWSFATYRLRTPGMLPILAFNPLQRSIKYAIAPAGRAMVEDVLPRFSELADPAIANVDHVLLVFALAQPPVRQNTLHTVNFVWCLRSCRLLRWRGCPLDRLVLMAFWAWRAVPHEPAPAFERKHTAAAHPSSTLHAALQLEEQQLMRSLPWALSARFAASSHRPAVPTHISSPPATPFVSFQFHNSSLQ